MEHGDFIDHLGFSFENTSTIVLSPGSLQALPIGFAGELCFGGDQVAAGYLGMPELTRYKFVDHPQLGRIYRSGDMGRMLPDGSLIVLGRMDDQLKLRGQRIDTGEISSILTTSGLATSSATAIVSRGDSLATQLAVFYVPPGPVSAAFEALPINDDLTEANNTLFGLLRSQLPVYMVPTYLIPVTSLPLTSSGKVDRARLQSSFRDLSQRYLDLAAGSSRVDDDESYWSNEEKMVASALSQVLGISSEEITRWQPLAALGLDSISAIPFARALQSVLKLKVPVSLILKSGSVARLAQELCSTKPGKNHVSPDSTGPFFSAEYVDNVKNQFAEAGRPASAVLPCTPLQEAMLSSASSASYSNQLVFKLHIPETDLKAYWEEMHRRHGILRTCFVTTRDTQRAVAQVILEDWTAPWHTMEANSLREAADEHLKSLSGPLDSRTPPLSLGILKIEAETYFSFTCHHALYDGVAMDLLLGEIEQLALGKPLQPPVDYLPTLIEIVNSTVGNDNFWQSQFNGFRPARRSLSTHSHEPLSKDRVMVETEVLGLSLGSLQSTCKAAGVSTLSFFQTVWSVFLRLAYDETDVCFGNVMSGRALDVDGIDRLIAPCFNTLPVRMEVSSSTQFLALLKKFQTLNPHLLERQFTSLRSIQNQISRTGKPLFESLLLLQHSEPERATSVWELIEDNGTMDVSCLSHIGIATQTICD